MRPAVRLAMAAVTTLAVMLPLTGVANAEPEPSPVPTQSQVDRAREAVSAKRQSVQQIQSQLAAANAQLADAAEEASIASEAYNGAMWRLSEARKAFKLAQTREQQAKLDVANQRDGIVSLVTESYQNGTELNAATAMMSNEGPKGLMNRYGVVESAGDSMEASYERFRAASAVAENYTKTAAKAEKRQMALAEEALELRDTAGALANGAALLVGQIAVQEEALITALAKAQNISVELAGTRQKALERIAQQRAAAAAKAREEAHAAELRKAAQEAAQRAKAAQKDQKKAESGSDPVDATGGGYTGPVDNTPPAVGTGVQRAIAYAKAQLGKPYLWAADGPDSFDCSGLTLMAWRAGGKSLPHWSVAQFAQSTRISATQVRPGDLVFWGSTPGTIHHVAMYIGNGQIIHAPRTGQPVQINSMYYWVPPNFFARP